MSIDYYTLSRERTRTGSTQEPIPASVAVAMDFIAMCNDSMGPASYRNGSGLGGEPTAEIRDRELHPKQEAAFACACNRLGRYFDQGK
jgi:hypothetical protein